MSDRAEFEATVMETSHDSWEVKRNLANELRATAQALAINVYTEYSTFRGCTKEAAYKEAREQVESYLRGAKDAADIVLQREFSK